MIKTKVSKLYLIDGLKKSTQEEFNIAVKREMHKNNE